MASFQVVEGGTPTQAEVAAIAAALEVVLAERAAAGAAAGAAAVASPWRWSGRPWTKPDWRRSRATAHPSRP